MPTNEFFSETYAHARTKFLSAAQDAGAAMHAYEHPSQRGPDGERLSIDVGIMGPPDASRGLLLISGTHGVEGFAGSGCQVGFFRDSLYEALGEGACAIVVHALNPYGFAWIRRVNEDNVDLNRNFQDFTQPLPRNEAYDALHSMLIPSEWDGAARLAADAQLQEFVRRNGAAALQTAVTAGQYSHPDGLFFGGMAETWSTATFKQIIETHIPKMATRLVVIDLHTGLGPFAYGEPILSGGGERQRELAKRRFGPEVKSLATGESTSSILSGTLANAFQHWTTGRDITFLGLEFGTKAVVDVLTALRGDHWLHIAQNSKSSLRDQIKKSLRDAFYIDTPHWQAAVYGRAADFVVRAARALSET
jgi:predicted deacylase